MTFLEKKSVWSQVPLRYSSSAAQWWWKILWLKTTFYAKCFLKVHGFDWSFLCFSTKKTQVMHMYYVFICIFFFRMKNVRVGWLPYVRWEWRRGIFLFISVFCHCICVCLIPPIEIFVIYFSLLNFLHINISKDYQLFRWMGL